MLRNLMLNPNKFYTFEEAKRSLDFVGNWEEEIMERNKCMIFYSNKHHHLKIRITHVYPKGDYKVTKTWKLSKRDLFDPLRVQNSPLFGFSARPKLSDEFSHINIKKTHHFQQLPLPCLPIILLSF